MKTDDRVKSIGEVFTPVKTVQEMLAAIPDEAWSNPDYTVLEPTCGEAVFILEVIKKRLSLGLDIKIIINHIFGLDIMEDNVQISRHEVKKLAHTTVQKQIDNKEISLKEAQNKYAYILCIIDNNIRTTKDTLQEDFSKFYYWHELPVEIIKPQYEKALEGIKKAKMFN